MPVLRPGAGLRPLLCYLRGHAEAVAAEARQSPALGAELLERVFGAGGRGFSYDRERRSRDDWYGFGPAAREMVCARWSIEIQGRPTGPICIDCEDLTAYFGAAALLSGAYSWVDVGIVPPPAPGQDGHAIVRVGPLTGVGLSDPIPPGLWDPSAWAGMRSPPAEFYQTADFLRLREQ